ncbi:hypothetical protein [Mesorhizobium sp. M0768]|uniref:hypothetical protein n=1 Tax=Mesorhizobium sp. M0768 TaxID=2956996 RepID=UPI0033391975
MQRPDHFAFYAARFSDPRIQALIRDAAQATLDWLRANKSSITAHGVEILKPWCDEPGYAATPPNKMVEKARHDTLPSQVYEQGIAKNLEIATMNGVLDIDPDELRWLVLARSAEVEGWVHVLTRYSWVNRPMNLEHFRDTGDYHPGCPQSHAKAKLARLARLGFVTVTKGKEFDIRVGPIAKTFYEDVWFPIKEEFAKKIGKHDGGKA